MTLEPSHLELLQEQQVVHQRECIEDIELGLIGQDDRVANEFRQSTLQEPEFVRVFYKGCVGRVVIEIGGLQE